MTLVGDRAAIFVQRGRPSARQQTDACLAYLRTADLPLHAIVPYWAPGDAVTMARNGEIAAIVTAFDSAVVRQLAEDIDGHGQVLFVHPAPTVIVPAPRGSVPLVGDLIMRWTRRGKSVRDIADDIGSTTQDVRDILRRGGEQPGRSD